jgi:hypothetical protein
MRRRAALRVTTCGNVHRLRIVVQILLLLAHASAFVPHVGITFGMTGIPRGSQARCFAGPLGAEAAAQQGVRDLLGRLELRRLEARRYGVLSSQARSFKWVSLLEGKGQEGGQLRINSASTSSSESAASSSSSSAVEVETVVVFSDVSAETLSSMRPGTVIESQVFDIGSHRWQV